MLLWSHVAPGQRFVKGHSRDITGNIPTAEFIVIHSCVAALASRSEGCHQFNFDLVPC